jgi:hypothetical protein
MEGFRVTPSQGSHFFHNITSLGIMYLTVPHDSPNAFMDWDELLGLPAVRDKKHVKHVRLPASVVVKVDGQSGSGVVFRPPGSKTCK